MVDTINIRYFEARDAEVCFKIRRAAFIEKFHQELGASATAAGVNTFMPDDYVRLAQTRPLFVAEKTGGGSSDFSPLNARIHGWLKFC